MKFIQDFLMLTSEPFSGSPLQECAGLDTGWSRGRDWTRRPLSSPSTLESSNHSSPEGKACRVGSRPREEAHIQWLSHTAASHLLARALAGFQVSQLRKNLELGPKALAATCSRWVGRIAYGSELPLPLP